MRCVFLMGASVGLSGCYVTQSKFDQWKSLAPFEGPYVGSFSLTLGIGEREIFACLEEDSSIYVSIDSDGTLETFGPAEEGADSGLETQASGLCGGQVLASFSGSVADPEPDGTRYVDGFVDFVFGPYLWEDLEWNGRLELGALSAEVEVYEESDLNAFITGTLELQRVD